MKIPATIEIATTAMLSLPGALTAKGKKRAKLLSSALGAGFLAVALVPGMSDTAGHQAKAASDSMARLAGVTARSSNIADAGKVSTAIGAETLLPSAALTAALPFRYNGSTSNRARAAECLAAAAWYEIGNDRAGQRAVMQTVINRVNHSGFPNSVCGVVFEGSQLSTGCQFTFTCDGSLLRRRPSAASWRSALTVAEEALDGYVDTAVGTATHYHADYVSPWWSPHLVRLAKVGPHIFYRWSGKRGDFASRTRLDAELDYDAMVRKAKDSHGDNMIEPLDGPPEPGLVGIAPNSLQPGRVERAMPVSNARFVTLDQNQASGRWAINAMKSCAGQSDCQVFGYGDAAASERNRIRDGSARERPLFLFVQDASSGMKLALWDCARIERPQSNQCLPEGTAALRAIMAER